ATIDVVFLGAPLAMGDDAAVRWIQRAAGCVAGLFGAFPTDVTVFVVPVAGAREVVFGRVMSLSGASVVLLFGAETRPESQRDDWVVVHELFHLGCPSFEGEGRWLEEGLATYYEPILRARVGWTSREDLWAHFVHEMPRGLRSDDEPAALEARDDIDGTYWGGALFAFLADVSIREQTAGARSLDDVLRAVLSRAGDATHVARVADFVRIADEATGTRAVAAVYDAWALHGKAGDLTDLWRRLGVETVERGVSLVPDAPLSGVRRAIETGSAH
ncbi:MAG TPA: hypothetical protein VKU41_12855, partial [Polyangiaceae bacterium]|nr:hypothetical protein [Polyangiaceae bacterium]